jgi:SOS-response transcriptional repressor LexA
LCHNPALIDLMEGFDQRLRQAFTNASISEIAAKLELSYHGARNYFEGRIPSAEKLKQISELTGYSIHWLLTGQGPKTTEAYPADETPLILENHVQQALNGLAWEEKKNPSEIIAHLITEALIERGLVDERLPAAQFRFYRHDSYVLVPIPLLGDLDAGKPTIKSSTPQQVDVLELFPKMAESPFALRVVDDSLADEEILKDDLIVCENSTSPRAGEPVVVVIDQRDTMLKRYYPRGGHIVLRAITKPEEDLVLSPARLTITGLVIGIQRPSTISK